MIIGPPPKFHGTRDILVTPRPAHSNASNVGHADDGELGSPVGNVLVEGDWEAMLTILPRPAANMWRPTASRRERFLGH